MSAFLESGADRVLFVDNCSTDKTPDLLAKITADIPTASVTRNRINLGYTRSFVKTFVTCEQDYIVYLSDEDAPTPKMVGTYRDILEEFQGLGVIARAVPYPDVWTIPELDETEILADMEDYVVIKPGLYAAHLATYQSTYVGGLMLRCDAAANFGHFSLERGSYPQKMLAMDAAYNAGLALVKQNNLGQFPKAHASEKQETMTRRQGDWGMAEWLETARFFDDFYPGDGISPAAIGAIREKQTRYALTRFAFYFENLSKSGYEPTMAFMRGVKQTSDLMGLASTWLFNFNWMKGRFTPEQMQLFHRCCRALDTERGLPQRNNSFLHDHTRFGRSLDQIPLCEPNAQVAQARDALNQMKSSNDPKVDIAPKDKHLKKQRTGLLSRLVK